MKRIIQVDFFRGLFLILIITNHFLSWRNVINHFTSEFVGWISAAEGFVFLSGLTAGIVYSRKLVEKGEAYITEAAKGRAWTIYKYHLFLFLLVCLVLFSHSAFEHYWLGRYEQDFQVLSQKPFLSVVLGALLLYQPIYMDILPMYALFLLLLPLALKHFQRGKHKGVLLLSAVVYAAGTVQLVSRFGGRFIWADEVDAGFFNLLSWQLLFIGGLYVGFLTYQGKIKTVLQHQPLFYTALGICVVLFLVRHLHHALPAEIPKLGFLVSKENLGPLRLLNFSALLLVVSTVAAKHKRWFSYRPLCFLGKYSLEVFSMHILLVFIFKPIKAFSNDFHAVKLMDNIYFYPWATLMLVLILIPGLFLAPLIKNRLSPPKPKTGRPTLQPKA